jgi:hypothetical protein
MTPTITSDVAELLGEPILCNPRIGRKLISQDAMRQLMRETGGLVILRGRSWTLKLQQVDETFVQLSLREV